MKTHSEELNMKKFFILIISFLVVSCSSGPDFDQVEKDFQKQNSFNNMKGFEILGREQKGDDEIVVTVFYTLPFAKSSFRSRYTYLKGASGDWHLNRRAAFQQCAEDGETRCKNL